MKIEPAQLELDADGLPRSIQFDDVYYSRGSAIAESEQVFLLPHELSSRWRNTTQDKFIIGELGFGFGLNFMLTLRYWLQYCQATKIERLHYIAFEKYPPDAKALEQVHGLWPELAEFSAVLRRVFPHQGAGCHRLFIHDKLILDLYLGDAETALGGHINTPAAAVDCWYLDGFSPDRNQELWQPSLLELIAAHSKRDCSLSSYSVAGNLRRGLAACGFRVEKQQGYGKKRHRLFARFVREAPRPAPTIWLPTETSMPANPGATVIGAGIAGCSVAQALARRGWRVKLLNGEADLKQGVNGLGQLALRLRLFQQESAIARFYLMAYLYSLRLFRQLAEQNSLDWQPTGLLQLAGALNRNQNLQPTALDELYGEDLLRHVQQSATMNISGLANSSDAFFLPDAGHLDPSDLARALSDHPNISLQNNCRVVELRQSESGWDMLLANGSSMSDNTVVLANGHACMEFEQCQSIPLAAVWGQVTRIAVTEQSEKLGPVICGERTVFPARDGRHLIAASYGEAEAHKDPEAINRENLALARENFAEPVALADEILDSKGAQRCQSPDFLPIVGPLPHKEDMERLLAPLARNARQSIAGPGAYFPGLYISTAHGSNGLSSCPLAGEYLASLINGEALPLDRDMSESLHPLRFLLRAIKRQELGV